MDYKQTQGQRKLQRLLDDLMRNKHFKRHAKKLGRLFDSEEYWQQYEKSGELTRDLYHKYFDWDTVVKAVIKREPSRIRQITDAMAIKYGLDSELIHDLILEALANDEVSVEIGYRHDLCLVNDDFDEQFNTFGARTPFILDTRKQQRILAFPVSISINKFATKRDVLDFIEKRWSNISNVLREYRKGEKLRVRKRKHPREIVDFLWKKRMLSPKKIKESLDITFPKNGIAYYEISKIIGREVKRRTRKLM